MKYPLADAEDGLSRSAMVATLDNLRAGVSGVCNSSELVAMQLLGFAADWWTRMRGAATEGNVCRKLREFCVT